MWAALGMFVLALPLIGAYHAYEAAKRRAQAQGAGGRRAGLKAGALRLLLILGAVLGLLFALWPLLQIIGFRGC